METKKPIDLSESNKTLAELQRAVSRAEHALEREQEKLRTYRHQISDAFRGALQTGATTGDPDRDTYLSHFGVQKGHANLMAKYLSFARHFGPQSKGNYLAFEVTGKRETMAHGGDVITRPCRFVFGRLSGERLQIAGDSPRQAILIPFEIWIDQSEGKKEWVLNERASNPEDFMDFMFDMFVTLVLRGQHDHEHEWISSLAIMDHDGKVICSLPDRKGKLEKTLAYRAWSENKESKGTFEEGFQWFVRKITELQNKAVPAEEQPVGGA
jgi:hypothetical protein